MPRSVRGRTSRLRKFASLFLIDAECEEDDLASLLVLNKLTKKSTQLIRGPYNAAHSVDFFSKLLYDFNDRSFKVFLR